MKTVILLVTVMITWFFSGCSSSEKTEKAPENELHVYASIPPVAYFAERIGGEHVRVSVLIEPGDSPHSFEPTPRQVMELGGADIYLRLGIPFENQLVNRLFTGSNRTKVVDVDKGITKRQMIPHDIHHVHNNHQHSERDHDVDHNGTESTKAEPDPHTWLSPLLIPQQARNITDALSEIDPSNRNYYEANMAAFLTEVDSVHRIIEAVLKPHRGRSFYTFHPAFGYLADAYGLVQEAVEIEGKSPSPKALNRLMEKARKEGVRIIFVQPQFDDKSARAVAQAIDGAVIPMDALKWDVLDNLRTMAEKIDLALQDQKGKRIDSHQMQDEGDKRAESIR